MNVYVIGSLHNPEVPVVAAALRKAGHDVFDDWYGAGEDADAYWQAYEQARGRTFVEALAAPMAMTTFELDERFLEWCEAAVLVLPAGKSGHLELGYAIGRGKDGFILLDGEPAKWDVMYNFATVVYEVADLVNYLEEN